MNEEEARTLARQWLATRHGSSPRVELRATLIRPESSLNPNRADDFWCVVVTFVDIKGMDPDSFALWVNCNTREIIQR